MRKIAKNTLVLATLFGAMVASANDFGGKAKAKSEVEKNLLTIESDPTFKKKGDKVLMNLLNLSQGKVILKVVDSEGRELFKEVIDGDLIVEKAFNFNNAFDDEYTIIVVDHNGTYKTTVKKK
ncbi:hypothetical protein [Croceivirga thetidis]|uniref:Secretion system C-terminal sorting domain-containing protein n=1 Tax=Croceivirga thetidis TaxID=2721623 RepID=A0ABX1GWS9_9FLAO|nr:hypothetical protein [Croceivirga thetidis]NKI33456.1 hypothetical protein [Croceivirga thetidis]